ncbi:hypothetical protein NIES22_26210 [Calothrix brevissima NIES-22]|nr:hypothetical protein NIES22_26210 [Calothrix brevissima NIES-22]
MAELLAKTVKELILAIKTADENPGLDVINLTINLTYNLVDVDNITDEKQSTCHQQ